MSLSDPYLVVTCDRDPCDEEIEVEAKLPYDHRTAGRSVAPGIRERGWIVDGDDHFCCEGHAEAGRQGRLAQTVSR